MIRVLVIDSSVAIKWFKPDDEPGLDEALALLEQHRERAITLAAPAHLRLEVLNALWSRRLDEATLRQVAQDLEDYDLEWHPIDSALARDAAAISARHRLTLYDAAFAALAVALDTELVTADRTLGESGACRVRLL
jgi:predicted nucleic acid-binding protein